MTYEKAAIAWAEAQLAQRAKRDYSRLVPGSVEVYFAAHSGWDTFGEPAGLGATISYRVKLSKSEEFRQLQIEDLAMEEVMRELFKLG